MRWRWQEEHSPPLSLSLALCFSLPLFLSLSSLRAARVIIVTLSQHHSHTPAHVVRRSLATRRRVTVNRKDDAGSSEYHYEMMTIANIKKKQNNNAKTQLCLGETSLHGWDAIQHHLTPTRARHEMKQVNAHALDAENGLSASKSWSWPRRTDQNNGEVKGR